MAALSRDNISSREVTRSPDAAVPLADPRAEALPGGHRPPNAETKPRGEGRSADATTILYSSTSLTNALAIIARGGIIPSRSGTAVSDALVGLATDSDQCAARCVTPLDLRISAELARYGGNWLRIWGTTARPAEHCPLALALLGVKTDPEVTIAFEADRASLKRPALWKSIIFQPTARWLAVEQELPTHRVVELIAHSPQAAAALRQAQELHHLAARVTEERFSERTGIRDTLAVAARPLAYAGFTAGAFWLTSHSGSGLTPLTATAVLAVCAVPQVVMLSIPNWPMVKAAGNGAIDIFKRFVLGERLAAEESSHTGGSTLRARLAKGLLGLLTGPKKIEED